jgi:hypothetical protein
MSEIIATANWTWGMFPGLSKGCINTLLSTATDELQQKWVAPMFWPRSCHHFRSLRRQEHPHSSHPRGCLLYRYTIDHFSANHCAIDKHYTANRYTIDHYSANHCTIDKHYTANRYTVKRYIINH